MSNFLGDEGKVFDSDSDYNHYRETFEILSVLYCFFISVNFLNISVFSHRYSKIKCFIVILIDNDSEDEAPSKTKAEKTVIDSTEVSEGQEDDSGETGNEEADDKDEEGDEDGEASQQEEGVDLSSEGDGKPGQSGSMSSRSESKSYSSVTHKCEVRNHGPRVQE